MTMQKIIHIEASIWIWHSLMHMVTDTYVDSVHFFDTNNFNMAEQLLESLSDPVLRGISC